MLRKKIIRALMENALYACFDYYCEFPAEAAGQVVESIRATAQVLYPDGGSGNGTMRTLRSQWLYKFCSALIDKLKDGNDG